MKATFCVLERLMRVVEALAAHTRKLAFQLFTYVEKDLIPETSESEVCASEAQTYLISLAALL